MTALIIVGSIVASALFLLFSHISLCVKIDEGFTAYLRYLVVKVRLPLEKKKTKRGKRVSSQSSTMLNESKKDKNIIAKMIKEKGLRQTVSELWETFKPIVVKAISTFKKIKVKRLDLKVTVATDDAAKTALEYGGICTAVFPALGFLKTQLKFPDRAANVHIGVDYNSDEPTLYLFAKLKIRLITALCAAMSALWTVFKSKFKKELEKKS